MILRRYPEPLPSFAITSPVMNMLGKLPFACPNPINILILVFHTDQKPLSELPCAK